jgi:uncharacterized RDD family membrane protein YckC
LLSKHATAARPGVPRKGQKRIQIGQLDALCAKMMAAKPEDRFASYEDLLNSIELASTETRRAGFWVRSLAMLLDFVLVGLVVGIARIGIQLAGGSDVDSMPIVLPLLAAFQALAVIRWGRSPGKAAMELEVVDVETLARPRPAQTIARTLMLFGFPIAAVTLEALLPGTTQAVTDPPKVGLSITASNWAGIGTLLWVIVCFVSLLFASPWISGRRTLWDHVAGTMVRYRTRRRSLAST